MDEPTTASPSGLYLR